MSEYWINIIRKIAIFVKKLRFCQHFIFHGSLAVFSTSQSTVCFGEHPILSIIFLLSVFCFSLYLVNWYRRRTFGFCAKV